MKKTTKKTTTTTKANIDVSKNALTVKLSIPTYKGQTKWNEGAKELATAHDADEDSVSSTLRALRPEHRRKIMGVRSRARSLWMSQTMPWTDNGNRLCPVAKYRGLRDALEALKIEFEEAKQDLVDRYDDIKADAQKRLNGLFDVVKFPSKEGFARRFQFNIAVGVIATGADVRIETLSDAELKRIRSEVDAENRVQIGEAQRDALARVAERIEHMIEKMLEEPKPAKPRKGKKAKKDDEPKERGPHFKDSIVTNIAEIAEEMRGMNVLQDAGFDKLLDRIAKASKAIDPEKLRQEPTARKNAAVNGKAMLREIDNFSF